MGVQVLIAGCTADEKSRVDSTVRRAIGNRAGDGPWSVSLVKLGTQWSVTIDGPEPKFKGLTLMAPDMSLQNALVEALTKPRDDTDAEAHSSSQARAASPSSGTRDQHQCPKCGKNFVVVYAAQPGERTTDAPVACSHCWQVTKVPVAASATEHEDYKAEAL